MDFHSVILMIPKLGGGLQWHSHNHITYVTHVIFTCSFYIGIDPNPTNILQTITSIDNDFYDLLFIHFSEQCNSQLVYAKESTTV